MNRYFISQQNIDWSKDRWVQKGYGWLPFQKYPKREGYIPLWDRNKQKFAWFKILRKAYDKYGYIVERRSVPTYWRNSVELLSQQDKGEE